MFFSFLTFSLPVRTYRKSYHTLPCVGIGSRAVYPSVFFDTIFIWIQKDQYSIYHLIHVLKDEWMDDLQFYVLLNSISVISGRYMDDNERLCAMELRLGLRFRRFHLE